jgi:hypothetical protein
MTTMAEAGGKVLKLPGEWDRVPVRGSRRVVPATAGWDVLSQIRYAAAVLPQFPQTMRFSLT